MTRERDFKQTLRADIDGFSLDAAVRRGADERQALEQLSATLPGPRLPRNVCRPTPPGRGGFVSWERAVTYRVCPHDLIQCLVNNRAACHLQRP